MQLKRGYILQDENERKIIIENLKMVDEVVLSADTDSSISLTLSLVMPDIFAKSGDRDKSNCPEYQTCLDLGIEFIDGLINTNTHSSDFIKIIQEYYISKEITP